MVEDFIPYALFVVVALIVFTVQYFRFRSGQELHATLREALAKDIELPETVIQGLGEAARSPRRDLRRGVLGLAVAGGFFAFALVLGEEDALRPLLATGTLPLIVGLGYLALARYDSEKG